jgi:hypothetical protein
VTPPAILVVTGIDGVGKSTVTGALEARGQPGIRCFRFETIGSPSLAAIMAEHGSPQAWQVTAMHQWITSLTANPWRCAVAVLEGEIPPVVVHQTFVEHGITRGRVVLLVCDEATRDSRAVRLPDPAPAARAQREAWARAFCDQAEALRIPVLDTTTTAVEVTVDRLLEVVEQLTPAG